MAAAGAARIELAGSDGTVTVLKEKVPLKAGEIIDCSVMNAKALRAFFAAQMDAAKKDGILFSLHVKTTMMKISDPIIFGHCVSVFFADVFEKHGATLKRLGVDPDTGVNEMMNKIETLPEAEKTAIKADIQAVYAKRPGLAMVNSDKGITNLHVPSDVIVDASMPAMIRESGKMWGADGKLHDTHRRDPRPLLLDAVPGGHRGLQGARRVRPEDHGLGPERRVDGAAGRRVRLARQDVPDCQGRHGARGRRGRHGPDVAEGRGRRHLPHVPGQGRADPGLGQARSAPRPPDQHARRCSGSTPSARTTRNSSPRSRST